MPIYIGVTDPCKLNYKKQSWEREAKTSLLCSCGGWGRGTLNTTVLRSTSESPQGTHQPWITELKLTPVSVAFELFPHN